ncbi:MAG: FAD-binding protein [Firmicutes bacterium]|nr:FAD-binding protein [Candidatus Colimorpha enterica]
MKIYNYDVIVIGTGAAGYNAACRIQQDGRRKVAIVTEGVNCGTSRNTGSDKQTYYKLGLGGDSPDSVRAMAKTLLDGGAGDGDNARGEAALSVRCFMNLCELGVKFPVNRYGEYVGYKTDHDPFARATSAGPLTSKFMTEALQKNASNLGVIIHDAMLAVEILKSGNSVCGVLCVDENTGDLAAFRCSDVIIATGGPAGIYADSAYPECHTGSTGLALNAGASTQNLTEWQYGLASIAPRWNVSGTHMQVLPRFVSVDADGKEYEFLGEYFSDVNEALSMVFLKGYQWPFDSRKVMTGSSIIDLLVYRECVLRKRRVYLDFTKNPFGLGEIDYKSLSKEAYEYLFKAGACFGKPIDRLLKMNSPAVDLYKGKGVDITVEYLEIALCAQHNNGGISVDKWWQTSVNGLFAAGECAGTHGITRPGGSALNAGQVGSLRASQYICAHPNEKVCENTFNEVLADAEKRHSDIIAKAVANDDNIASLIAEAQRRMSDGGAAMRNKADMVALYGEISDELKNLSKKAGVREPKAVFLFYKLRDILTTQKAVLAAMIDYADRFPATRGSALYYNKDGSLREGLEEMFRFNEEKGETRASVQEVKLDGDKVVCEWRDVRPIPEDDDFFENVWRVYRENGNIY